MQVFIRPEALAEVREGCRWYDERVPGLGTEFARAVDAAISAAARNPDGYPAVEGELRRVLLRACEEIVASGPSLRRAADLYRGVQRAAQAQNRDAQ